MWPRAEPSKGARVGAAPHPALCMSYETILYTIYVASMAAGALLFLSWMRDPKGVPVWEYIVAAIIPIWSGLAYLAMGLGLGTAEIAGQTTYWARYADWVVTTPLLLVALWLTATTRGDKSKHVPLLLGLVAADIIMILSGLVGDLSTGTARFVYFGIGVAALVVLFALVWGPLKRVAEQDPEIGSIYRKVAAYLGLFWIGYPLTWILGPSGLGIVGQDVDTALFILLPIFSKVGFSIFDLSQLRRVGGERLRTAVG